MKKCLQMFFLILTFATGSVFGQVLLNENFDYTAGGQLVANNWIQSGSSSTNPILVSSAGLSYTGYPSIIGNAATLMTTGQDVYRSFDSVATGNVYLSFMLNVASAQTGDYFIALSPVSSQTNYTARLHAKASGAGYVLGLKKSSESNAVYGTTELAFNTTYVVVVKYKINAAATNDDAVSAYVFADPTLPSDEPATQEIAPYTGDPSKKDVSALGYVTIRQGSTSSAAALTIDGIRVARSWSELFPPKPSVGDYGTAGNGDYDVASTWVICANEGTWTDATAASKIPDSTKNVWIRSGHTINYKASGKFCKNLIVEEGAVIKGDAALPTSDIRYLRVVGTSVKIYGSFGSDAPGDNLSFEFFHNLTVEGSGKINPARIRPGSKIKNAALTIDCNMNLMYAGSSGTGGAAIYTGNSSNDNITVTLNEGRTLTFVDYAYLGTSSSTSTDGTASTVFNINGTLIQQGVSATTTLRVAAGKTCELNIGSTGSMSISKNLNASLGAGTTTIKNDGVLNLGTGGNGTIDFSDPNIYISGTGTTNIEAGAKLKIGAPSGLEPVAGPIRTTNRNFSESAKYDYVGTTAQVTGSDLPSTVFSLIIEDTAGVTLSAKVTVTDTASIAANASLIETDTTYVSGVIKTTQTVGTNASTFGGIGVELNAGNDNLGDVTVIRTSGKEQNDVTFTSIKRSWDISCDSTLTSGRDLSFSWPSGDDNNLTLTKAIVFKSTDSGSSWSQATDVLGVDISGSHKITVSGVNSLSSLWTVGEIVSVGIDDNPEISYSYNLYQNYPNPFNPSTSIKYEIKNNSRVKIVIFNALGQVVSTLVDREQSAGNHVVNFDASKLSSGVYFYTINAGSFVQTKKMILMK